MIELGPVTLREYNAWLIAGVLLALIIIVCLTAISNIGSNANQTFSDVADQLGSTGG